MIVVVILSVCLLVKVNDVASLSGSDPVEISKYPFAAALVTNNGQGPSFRHGCGGSILTQRAILSAASCFYTETEVHPASWWRARVGSTFSNEGGTIYLISAITPHPEFSPTSLDNDIAVLRTSLEIRLVPGSVEIARLSGAAYTHTQNQRMRAIGWGATRTSNDTMSSSRELREVEVFTISQTTCANRWNAPGFRVTDNMVCNGWLDVGVIGQCGGDTGSPLLDNNDKFVVGVFSRADGCGEPWYPDINTRVQPYVSWIVSTAIHL